jgi:C4-dicarboxylate-binding protein DctP
MTLCIIGSAEAEQPIVIKFSHVVSSDAAKGKAAAYFKKLAEERTAGRVRVDVHPKGELYTDNEEFHALRSGDVQMLAPSVSKFSQIGLPQFEIFDIPYLIDSEAAWQKATQGPVGLNLLKQLEPKGMIGLGYWSGGLKHMSSNKALHRPDDASRLKMRIQLSQVIRLQMHAIKAIPQSTAFSDVFDSLRAGVFDGTENPASTFYTSHFDRVQKYLTLTGHGYLGYAVISNKRFWDGLPPDIRNILQTAVADTARYQSETIASSDKQAIDAIARDGKAKVVSLNPEELAEWKKAMSGVAFLSDPRVGRDNIAKLRKDLGSEQ